MKKLLWTIFLLTCVLVSGLFPQTSHAGQGFHYSVTITNLTHGQIITPPILITHNEYFSLFKPGAEASQELSYLAEEGNTEPLESLLETLSSVGNVATADVPLFPGESVTLEIRGSLRARQITAAGMLASSNDAFFAVRGVQVFYGQKTVYARAYDAGTEGNSESCLHVPGPPCGSANARYPDEAEGFVYIHSGIHGIVDLTTSEHDWQNPVVAVTIKRIP
jgi:hypothetical protein